MTVPIAREREAGTENLAGLVERVTFHSLDNGFCVLRVMARGQRDLVTVIGHAALIAAGEFVVASGMIRGIGPAYAKRLTQTFGNAVFDVIEQEPTRLREIDGIGPRRAGRIVAGWAEQKAVREIMLFLHANGVGTSRAVRIYKTYGAEAVGHQRQSLPARTRHPRHRLPHRRPNRHEGGHRQGRHDPHPGGRVLRAD